MKTRIPFYSMITIISKHTDFGWKQDYALSSRYSPMNWLIRYYESESEVSQSCPTICDPMDCGLPGSSVHWILQARILEWVAISFSRGSSRPRNRTQVSRIAGRRFNLWATRKPLIRYYRLLELAVLVSCNFCILKISWDYYELSLTFVSPTLQRVLKALS